jgi:hypothetical protein
VAAYCWGPPATSQTHRVRSIGPSSRKTGPSVEIVGTEPSDPEEQLELEKDAARAALESR